MRCAHTLSLQALFLSSLFVFLPVRTYPQTGPGEIIDVSSPTDFSIDQIIERSEPFFESFDRPQPRYPVRSFLVRYRSTDFDGTPAEITAQLFIPLIPVKTERPVYVFGAGTTGIADPCAPSLEEPGSRRWGFGHYRTNMLAYSAQGYIVMFPDYLGFGDETRPQRYFSKYAEGYVMLDAIRAVYEFFERYSYQVRPSSKVFTAGYSQGGHAAMAAADLQAAYAPEISITGMIGYGTTNNIITLLKEAPVYAPHIFYSYAEMYGWGEIEPSEYLQGQYAATLAYDVERMCVAEFQVYYPNDGGRLYTPEFYQALKNDDLDTAFPFLAARLRENKAGLGGHGVPALIIHGLQDSVVSTTAQTLFAEELRAAGSSVELVTMDQVWHRHTRPAGFWETIRWMEGF